MPDNKSVIQELKELEQRRNELLSLDIDEYLEDFRNATTKPLVCYIQGWTPGFNDGDPCTHGVDWGVGGQNLSYMDQLDPEYRSHLFNEFVGDEDEIPESKLADAPIGFEDVISEIIIPICDKRWETDYQVLIWIHQGEIKVLHDDYDCGY